MLNGDGNDNGNKINRSNKKFARAAHFFVHFIVVVFLQMQCRFARVKCQTSSLHIIFYGGIVVCAHQKFWCLSSCSLLSFLLSLIFTLLAASISHLSDRRYKIFMFFFQRNSSPLFSVTRSSSFWISVIQGSVDIKNNVEKDSTLLLFFLSKSLGWLCAKIKNTSSLLPVVSYLLIELFYIGMSLVWTDGRTGVWSSDY